MNRLPFVIFGMCVIAVACKCQPIPDTITPTPEPPQPPPVEPQPSISCETAHANLAQLGGCGVDLDRFVQDCKDASEAEAELGIVFPKNCLSIASSCDDARRCK